MWCAAGMLQHAISWLYSFRLSSTLLHENLDMPLNLSVKVGYVLQGLHNVGLVPNEAVVRSGALGLGLNFIHVLIH